MDSPGSSEDVIAQISLLFFSFSFELYASFREAFISLPMIEMTSLKVTFFILLYLLLFCVRAVPSLCVVTPASSNFQSNGRVESS